MADDPGWTFETLVALLAERDVRFQQRFEASEKAVSAALDAAERATQAAFVAADRATTKAETANERRFDSVNEFRAQLTDQAATFITRNEYDAKFTALGDRLDAATKATNDKLDEIAKQSLDRTAVLAATMEARFTAVVTSIGQIASRIDKNDGRSTGLNAGWGYLVGVIGLALTVISIISLVIR